MFSKLQDAWKTTSVKSTLVIEISGRPPSRIPRIQVGEAGRFCKYLHIWMRVLQIVSGISQRLKQQRSPLGALLYRLQLSTLLSRISQITTSSEYNHINKGLCVTVTSPISWGCVLCIYMRESPHAKPKTQQKPSATQSWNDRRWVVLPKRVKRNVYSFTRTSLDPSVRQQQPTT
jgi:hypothetical protein